MFSMMGYFLLSTIDALAKLEMEKLEQDEGEASTIKDD